jgi:outer membrane protein OmpA-like peptidoglycan-associated protein
MEEQKNKMEAATEGTKVSVTQTADNQLKLNVPSDISFDTGQSTIKLEMHPVLDSLAAGLKSNSNSQATIIGYTDDTGNDSINIPLSVNRAASTRAYLVSQGIDSNRISIDGRGASEPVAANTSPENRAKNRRVEIFVKEPQPQPQPTTATTRTAAAPRTATIYSTTGILIHNGFATRSARKNRVLNHGGHKV